MLRVQLRGDKHGAVHCVSSNRRSSQPLSTRSRFSTSLDAGELVFCAFAVHSYKMAPEFASVSGGEGTISPECLSMRASLT